MRVAEDGWFRAEIPVRFRDLDSMGHAHHTLPLIYLEEARAAFWRELKGNATIDAIDYVMAEITLRFHARIRYPSNVMVALKVSGVGTKSFTTDFEICDTAGALLSSGTAVQVAYEYETSRSKPLLPADRSVLEAWLDRSQNNSAMPAETAPIIPPST